MNELETMHWSELNSEEMLKLPLHKRLAWHMFWRRFMSLGIVAEGEKLYEILDEVAAEIENLMRVCHEDGAEEERKKLQSI